MKLPRLIALSLLSFSLSGLTLETSGLHWIPSARAQAGYTVQVLDQTWRDEPRQREVPVRIRMPQTRLLNERLPVILFSHGLGGSREAGEKWGEFWATHGYIVVHLQHPGSDENIFDRLHSPLDIMRDLRLAATGLQLRDRIFDVKFILDELSRRAEFRQADLARIGMSGHSFGALTTQVIAGQSFGARVPQNSDPRIKAAIAFSPTVRNRIDAETQFGEVRIPFLSVTGTLDGEVYGLGVAPEERIRPFYAMPAGNKYLLVFYQGDHMVFNGRPGRLERPRRPEAQAEEPRIIRTTQMITLAFWDAHLRDMSSAQRWLQTRVNRSLGSRDRWEQR